MTKTTLFPTSQRQTHEARSLPHRIKQRPHHDPVFYFDMTLAQDRIDVLSHAKFWKCFPTTRGQPILSSKWRRSTTPEEELYSECNHKCCSYCMKTAFQSSSESWARSNSSRADKDTEKQNVTKSIFAYKAKHKRQLSETTRKGGAVQCEICFEYVKLGHTYCRCEHILPSRCRRTSF